MTEKGVSSDAGRVSAESKTPASIAALLQTVYAGLLKGGDGDSAPFIALTGLADRLSAMETALDQNLAAGVEEQKLRDRLHERVAELRSALGAYRSAMRSGEPETDQLRAFGDAALTSSTPPEPVRVEATQDG